MIDVIYDYRERVSQIEKYLNFIVVLDNISDLGDLTSIKENRILINENQEIIIGQLFTSENTFKIETELTKVLKSNTVLLLYNLIEGTVSAVLNEFFGTLNQENLKYSCYQNEIKQIWIKYKHRSFSVKEKSENSYIVNIVDNIFDEIITIEPKTVKDNELGTKLIYNYEAYVAETQLNEISGNLDARKIKEIFRLYGLPDLAMNCDSMLKIKNKRNSLAHGNETFAQVGGTLTLQELINIKDEIKSFLQFLLTETEQYLNQKKYLKPTPLPKYKNWWQRLLGV